MKTTEADILVVEDSKSDAELIVEALRETGLRHRTTLVPDGGKALSHLRKQASNPHLILLDLNLPKKHGLEVLKELRADPRFRVIPVVILTNSDGQEDVQACYAHGANAYVRKPVGFEKFLDLMVIVGKFWFEAVTHPSTPNPPPPRRSKRPTRRPSKARKKTSKS